MTFFAHSTGKKSDCTNEMNIDIVLLHILEG